MNDKAAEYRAVALKLSEAIAAADRLVTEHYHLFEELEAEDVTLADNPAGYAMQGMMMAISEASEYLTDIRDRLGAPEWLATEEGCEA